MDESIASVVAQATTAKSLTPETEKHLKDLLKLHKPNAFKRLSAVQYGGQSKQVELEITAKLDEIELWQMADVQFGHKDCKYAALDRYLQFVLEKPNRFLLLVGDIVDAAHAFTPGIPFDNLFAPDSQVYRIAQYFAPVRHRILGYVGGNHERRGLGSFGDLGVLIALLLGIPYSNGRQYLNIKFGKHDPFQVLLWHGHPRARTKGALAQILDRFMGTGKAQLYLSAHNHQSIVLPACREIVEKAGIRSELVIGATCTSFLETYGTYAEWMGFPAYDILMPRVRLFKDGTWRFEIPSKCC